MENLETKTKGRSQAVLLARIDNSMAEQTALLEVLVELTSHGSKQDRRRSGWDVATSVGYVLAFIGTLAAAGMAYFGTSNQVGRQSSVELCRIALEALNDESPNPALSPDKKLQLIDLQMKLAQKCYQETKS